MKIHKTIALFCVLCLSVTALAGCGTKAPEESDASTPPAQSQKPASGTNLTVPDTPGTEQSSSPWGELQYGETKDFTIMIEGMEETVTMTYMVIDFSWRNAPNVAMYIDRERYTCGAFEGEYDVVPIESGEDPICRLHIFPNEGKTAQEYYDELKPRIVEGWGEVITGEGTTQLDGHTTLFITTETSTYYFIDYDGGCVSVSLNIYNPEAVEGHGGRLAETVKTVMILD